MRDNISLVVDGRKIEHFLGYSIEADLYQAADAFSLELANPEIKVTAGARCELYVNNTLELTGIVDKVVPGYDKSSVKLKLEGRDLMGLLVDSHCEEFLTLQGYTLQRLAERLLKTVPFINRKAVLPEDKITSGLNKKKKAKASAASLLDTPQAYSQIEPGMSIFEVLRDFAHNRGLLFYSLPDGTFVFGKPIDSGEPLFTLATRKDGQGNNIKDAVCYNDISRSASKITVIGQQQGVDDFGLAAAKIRTRASVLNPAVPFHKPLVVKNNNDTLSPKNHARLILEKQRHDAFQLFYKVGGHSQNGRNWQINQLCRVQDEVFGIDGVYLIYNRVLELHKDEGAITWLKIGLPGVVA